MTLAFDLFEGAVVPMLLYNSECFVKMNSRTLKMLERLQLKYLRLVFAVGTGCPIVMLLTQTASLFFSNRIWLRKCLFLFHVSSLPVGTLARDIFDKQRELNIVLYKECEPLLEEFGMLNFEQYSKYTWKKELKRKILLRNHQDIIAMCERENYSKVNIDTIRDAPFKVSDYFMTLNVDDSRLRFKTLSRMTPSVASNHSSSRKFREKGLLCVGCAPLSLPPSLPPGTSSDPDRQTGTERHRQGTRDTEEHIMYECSAYADLRNFESLRGAGDKQIVDFFKSVIQRRAEQNGV